jgi:ABC-type transport system involved in multi-copper enzyme maturation permease subunit
MLKALLWKEWQEQRWRMALVCVWLLGITGIVLKTRIMPDGELLDMIGIIGGVILPIYLGMGLFALERKNGTFAHLLAQPVGRGRVLTAKVIVGLLAYVGPMAICGIMICLTVGGREVGSIEIIATVAAMTVFGVMLFSWELLAGLRCRREETYILVSAIVLACWFLHAGVHLGFWISALNPSAVLGPGSERVHVVWPAVAVQSAILVGVMLGLWFRFRRLREGRS